MVLYKDVVINHCKGLHARVLAIVVHKVSELQKKYNVEFFIIFKNKNYVYILKSYNFIYNFV
ncbi:hypothetical protein ACER0A_001305 [Haloimpatiens sp. FM7315]|uniref:hypothetical protein n=1 Tax=Haloimpatiens sp. FM7315 TaxID=3298609 RepID=UPI0035A2D857